MGQGGLGVVQPQVGGAQRQTRARVERLPGRGLLKQLHRLAIEALLVDHLTQEPQGLRVPRLRLEGQAQLLLGLWDPAEGQQGPC